LPIDAVLLAGRENQGLLRGFSDARWEALVPLGGKAMATWVALAALGSPSVKRLAVVGPTELAATLGDGRVVHVDPGGDMFDNLMRGVSSLGGSDRVVVLSSDIPLATSKMVEDFIRRAEGVEADFVYPIIPKERVEATFGASRRTYVKLRQGTFTGGNLILVNTAKVERLAQRARGLIALRKSPLGLAREIGVGFLLRFLLLRPPLQDLERHFSRIMGLTARALIVDDAALGVDVDRPEDLILFQKFLQDA